MTASGNTADPAPDDAHRVCRPAWTCAVDGEPWPCPPARRALTHAYRTDSAQLTDLLFVLMEQAASDLRVPDPTKLYRRFVAWAPRQQLSCRLCGKSSHDAIPGTPPRLLPCEVAKRLHPDDFTEDQPAAGDDEYAD